MLGSPQATFHLIRKGRKGDVNRITKGTIYQDGSVIGLGIAGKSPFLTAWIKFSSIIKLYCLSITRNR